MAFLPFALLFLGAVLSTTVDVTQRAIIIWLAAAFLGYNFAVADPGTHIYIIAPPWVLLAGLMAATVWDKLVLQPVHVRVAMVGCFLVGVLFSGYLYIAFLRQDVEFRTEWPDSHLGLYWFPYEGLPEPDASFGFVHKEGWKAIGGLYAGGRIAGEYQTNGKYGAADWYTRYHLRGCYHQSRNFFTLKGEAIDPLRFADYTLVGEAELPYGKGFNILQAPPGNNLGQLDVDQLEQIFDQTARPAAFVRPTKVTRSVEANLANFVELVKYHVTNSRAQPSEQIGVLLTWQLKQEIPVDLDVFVHFESDEKNGGAIWGQSNGNPACGEYPTSRWAIGEAVEDLHLVTIDPDTPPGIYRLSAGMYLPEGNQRLPLFDETGQPVAEAIELMTFYIQ
jgi:hypothetical protein